MDEQQPTAEWVFPPKKKHRRRIAVIVLLGVLAVAVTAGLVLLLIPRSETHLMTGPTATPTATVPAPARTASGSPTGTPASPEPQATPPAVPDPSVSQFRTQVGPRLSDGSTGLNLLQGQAGDQAVQIVESLQGDAQFLAGQPAPQSIRAAWERDLNVYASKLQDLRSALGTGADASTELAAARSALDGIQKLIGM